MKLLLCLHLLKRVNYLNNRVAYSEKCLAHCFFEQMYWRLHRQPIISTETQLGVEETALWQFLPLTNENTHKVNFIKYNFIVILLHLTHHLLLHAAVVLHSYCRFISVILLVIV